MPLLTFARVAEPTRPLPRVPAPAVGSLFFSSKDQENLAKMVNQQVVEARADIRQSAGLMSAATFSLTAVFGAAVLTSLYLSRRPCQCKGTR